MSLFVLLRPTQAQAVEYMDGESREHVVLGMKSEDRLSIYFPKGRLFVHKTGENSYSFDTDIMLQGRYSLSPIDLKKYSFFSTKSKVISLADNCKRKMMKLQNVEPEPDDSRFCWCWLNKSRAQIEIESARANNQLIAAIQDVFMTLNS